MKKIAINLFGYLIFLPIYAVVLFVNFVTGEILDWMKEFDEVLAKKGR